MRSTTTRHWFRGRRSTPDALGGVGDESWRSHHRWVAESDRSNCLEATPYAALMSGIEERIVDRHLLKHPGVMSRDGVPGERTVQTQRGSDRRSG